MRPRRPPRRATRAAVRRPSSSTSTPSSSSGTGNSGSSSTSSGSSSTSSGSSSGSGSGSGSTHNCPNMGGGSGSHTGHAAGRFRHPAVRPRARAGTLRLVAGLGSSIPDPPEEEGRCGPSLARRSQRPPLGSSVTRCTLRARPSLPGHRARRPPVRPGRRRCAPPPRRARGSACGRPATPKYTRSRYENTVTLTPIPSAIGPTGYMPTTRLPAQKSEKSGPRTLDTVTLNGGRTLSNSRVPATRTRHARWPARAARPGPGRR